MFLLFGAVIEKIMRADAVYALAEAGLKPRRASSS